MDAKGTTKDWEYFQSLGDKHVVGDEDCPACYVAQKHDCGGVMHSIEVMMYVESLDVGYIRCCDQCFENSEG